MIFQTERLILHAFGDLHNEIRKNRRTKNEREDQMFCPPAARRNRQLTHCKPCLVVCNRTKQ